MNPVELNGEISAQEPATSPTVEAGGVVARVDALAERWSGVLSEISSDRVTGDNVEGGHDPGDESEQHDSEEPIDDSDDRDLASPSYSAGARPEDDGRESIAEGDARYYRAGGARLLHPDVARVRCSHASVIVPEPGCPKGGYTHRRAHDVETDEEWIPDDPDELAAIVASIGASNPDLSECYAKIYSFLGLEDLPSDVDRAAMSAWRGAELLYATPEARRDIERGFTGYPEIDAEAHAALECALVDDRKARACSVMAGANAYYSECWPTADPYYLAVERALEVSNITKQLSGVLGISPTFTEAWGEAEARLRNGEIGDES